jgi:hypothetical protein
VAARPRRPGPATPTSRAASPRTTAYTRRRPHPNTVTFTARCRLSRADWLTWQLRLPAGYLYLSALFDERLLGLLIYIYIYIYIHIHLTHSLSLSRSYASYLAHSLSSFASPPRAPTTHVRRCSCTDSTLPIRSYNFLYSFLILSNVCTSLLLFCFEIFLFFFSSSGSTYSFHLILLARVPPFFSNLNKYILCQIPISRAQYIKTNIMSFQPFLTNIIVLFKHFCFLTLLLIR